MPDHRHETWAVANGPSKAERWRGLRFTEFELRQIAAVRKDLDDEYQTLITPRAASSQPRISSKSMP